ncbi:MAG: hypothetical protein Q9170_001762 [Blastenia crenularia]
MSILSAYSVFPARIKPRLFPGQLVSPIRSALFPKLHNLGRVDIDAAATLLLKLLRLTYNTLKSKAVANDSNNISSLDEKREPHRDPAFETGVYGYDVEKTEERGRKMSRVAGPKAIGITDTDEDSVMSVGKQMELEASNAIKYRTCSWQKVT